MHSLEEIYLVNSIVRHIKINEMLKFNHNIFRVCFTKEGCLYHFERDFFEEAKCELGGSILIELLMTFTRCHHKRSSFSVIVSIWQNGASTMNFSLCANYTRYNTNNYIETAWCFALRCQTNGSRWDNTHSSSSSRPQRHCEHWEWIALVWVHRSPSNARTPTLTATIN